MRSLSKIIPVMFRIPMYIRIRSGQSPVTLMTLARLVTLVMPGWSPSWWVTGPMRHRTDWSPGQWVTGPMGHQSHWGLTWSDSYVHSDGSFSRWLDHRTDDGPLAKWPWPTTGSLTPDRMGHRADESPRQWVIRLIGHRANKWRKFFENLF